VGGDRGAFAGEPIGGIPSTEDGISTGGWQIPSPVEARLPVRPTPWLAHGTIGKPVGLPRARASNAPELSAPSQARRHRTGVVSISGGRLDRVKRDMRHKTSDRFGSLFDSGAAGSPSSAASNADRRSTCSLPPDERVGDVAPASHHTPSVAIRPPERPRVVQELFKSCSRVVQELFKSCWRGIAIQALTPPGLRSSQRSCIHHITSNS
jgi:hypothetical protein